MKYSPINPNLFIENRKRLTGHLKPGSIAIINSNDEMPRNGDAAFPFRQNSDIFYLSGIDQEQSILVICPDATREQHREILFLRETNETIAIWEGHKYTKEEATKTSGIKTVYWLSQFDQVMHELMIRSEYIYLNLNENIRATVEVNYRDLRFVQRMKEKYPLHKFERLGPIFDALRSIKHSVEVDLMQNACDITEKAFRRVLSFVKPGVHEYEIEAEVTHEFLRNRATGHAYTPIIAAGYNSCVLHYIENSQKCKKGDILLLDFGAEYANYAADLSRTIPVSGKYSKRQKEVYEAVLRVMKFAKSMLVPGTVYLEYEKEVGKFMESELLGLKLIDKKDIKKQNPAWPAYKKYFMHGTSHFLGIDVHDVGNRDKAMVAGMVFTCEPGIYIPEENLGIRIENDILLTKSGNIDLMEKIPIEADEIESLMNAKA